MYYVYLAEDDEKYKVGYSLNVEKRVKSLGMELVDKHQFETKRDALNFEFAILLYLRECILYGEYLKKDEYIVDTFYSVEFIDWYFEDNFTYFLNEHFNLGIIRLSPHDDLYTIGIINGMTGSPVKPDKIILNRKFITGERLFSLVLRVFSTENKLKLYKELIKLSKLDIFKHVLSK